MAIWLATVLMDEIRQSVGAGSSTFDPRLHAGYPSLTFFHTPSSTRDDMKYSA